MPNGISLHTVIIMTEQEIDLQLKQCAKDSGCDLSKASIHGNQGHEIRLAIFRKLADPDPDVRLEIYNNLRCNWITRDQLADLLKQAVKHEDRHIRKAAKLALRYLDSDTPQLVSKLISVLDSDISYYDKISAISHIGEIGSQAKSAVLALENIVRDGGMDRFFPERVEAIKALGRIGPTAVPILIEVVENYHGRNLHYAAHALMHYRLDIEKTVNSFIKRLHITDGSIHIICQALAALGERSKPAVPILMKRLEEDTLSDTYKRSLLHALGSIGPAAKSAIPLLLNYLENKSTNLQFAAESALCKIGAHAREIVPDLIEKLTSEDPTVRWLAGSVLAAMGSEAKDAVPHLITTLTTTCSEIEKRSFIEFLGDIGPSAIDALSVIREALSSPATRDEAKEAIRKIENKAT